MDMSPDKDRLEDDVERYDDAAVERGDAMGENDDPTGDRDLSPEASVEPESRALEPRVSVVSEQPPPADVHGDEEDEFRWHTDARHAVEGVEDAVEFVDVHKAFGRNQVLRALNLGI